MKIGTPQLIHESGQVIYRVGVETALGSDTLWYSVNESFADLLSDSGDATVVALLIPAMAIGEDLYVNGVVSERLLYNLSGPLQRLLQHVIPSLRPVRIRAADVFRQQVERPSGVASGFSGGIDSYCVLADHYYANILERYKVTHLLFNNVGSHGSGGERLFRHGHRIQDTTQGKQ